MGVGASAEVKPIVSYEEAQERGTIFSNWSCGELIQILKVPAEWLETIQLMFQEVIKAHLANEI